MRIRSLPTWLRVALALLLLLAIAYPLVLKGTMGKASDKTRGTSSWPPPPIRIAVPWPGDEAAGLVQGVKLALEELDAGGGPLAGKVKVSYFNEPESLADDGALARRIASDQEVVAVIGHESSASALQAAVTYERHGILHLSPQATLSRMTYHRFQYTFRMVPNDDSVAAALVEFARSKGWKHIGILYARIEESEALAQVFSLTAIQEGLVPSYASSYLPAKDYRDNDFRPLLAASLDRPADAILLADRLPWAGKMLIDMQALGMKQPVLAGDNLDSAVTWDSRGQERREALPRLVRRYRVQRARLRRLPRALPQALRLAAGLQRRPGVRGLHALRQGGGALAQHHADRGRHHHPDQLLGRALRQGVVHEGRAGRGPQGHRQAHTGWSFPPIERGEPVNVVLIMVALSIVIGFLGRKRRFGFWGYFFLSMLLTPVVGLLALIAAIPRSEPRERRR